MKAAWMLPLLCLLLAGCGDGPAEKAGQKLDEQVTDAREDVKEIQNQIEQYRKQIEETRAKLADAEQRLQAAEKELETARQQRQEALRSLQPGEQPPAQNSPPAPPGGQPGTQ